MIYLEDAEFVETCLKSIEEGPNLLLLKLLIFYCKDVCMGDNCLKRRELLIERLIDLLKRLEEIFTVPKNLLSANTNLQR